MRLPSLALLVLLSSLAGAHALAGLSRRAVRTGPARVRPALCTAPQPASQPAPQPERGVPSAPPSPPWPEQLQLFWRLATPYFRQEEGAKIGFILLLALTLLNSGVSVLFSYTSRDFWTALSSRDADQFYMLTLRFAGALALATPVSVLYKYQRGRVAVSWREWMTTRLTEMYYDNEAYYRLELGGGVTAQPSTNSTIVGSGNGSIKTGGATEIEGGIAAAAGTMTVDNPDQRIAEDARAFTRVSLDFGITLLTSAIDLVSFSTILW